MTKLKILMIFLIFSCICMIINTKESKCLKGTTILTRTKIDNNKFQLKYQCLCPIDFFGNGCRYHRNIHCYLTKKSISPTDINQKNFKEAMDVTLQVNAECFIQQDFVNFVPLLKFLIQRQRTTLKLDFQLQTGTVENNKQIIWANNTNLFYYNGKLKPIEGYNYTLDNQNRTIMSQQDEQKYLNQFAPSVKFLYKSKFLGFPFSDSLFYVTSNILRPIQNRIYNGKQPLIWINQQIFIELINQTSPSSIQKANQYLSKFSLKDLLKDDFWDQIKQKFQTQKQTLNGPNKQLLPYFQTNISIHPQQAAQFQNIRIETSIIEYYEQNIYTSQTAVNSVEFILPLKVPGMAQAKVYSVNFNKKQVSRWTYFLIGLILFAIGYSIFALRRRKIKQRRAQIQQRIEQKDQYVPWK